MSTTSTGNKKWPRQAWQIARSNNVRHGAWWGATGSREVKHVQQPDAIRLGDHIPDDKILHNKSKGYNSIELQLLVVKRWTKRRLSQQNIIKREWSRNNESDDAFPDNLGYKLWLPCERQSNAVEIDDFIYVQYVTYIGSDEGKTLDHYVWTGENTPNVATAPLVGLR
jgi:hypothetical protein